MSTTAPTTPSQPSPQRDVTAGSARPIPLHRLVRVELRKMVDTRSGLWLLVAIAVLSAGAVGLFLAFGPEDTHTFYGFAGMALIPQAFLLPVLGILLVTSEWSQRAGLVTFTLEPRRGLVVLSKTVAALIVGLVGLALLLGVAAFVTLVSGTPVEQPWDMGWREVGYFTIVQTLAILQGVAFGLLLMNSTAAIVLYFALPVAMNLLITFVETLRENAGWFDLATAQAPLLTQEALTGEQWAQVGTVTLLWIVLPLVLGWLRLRRTEIKTA
ncbi:MULTISPECIES: ABC transporter permease [unclassified Ornithinimicrobium]|uniref:ABC transporter permease n=1 Tax=unclassified Ornithinimicrobium TaxID=2615080 RepID=UPI003852AD33